LFFIIFINLLILINYLTIRKKKNKNVFLKIKKEDVDNENHENEISLSNDKIKNINYISILEFYDINYKIEGGGIRVKHNNNNIFITNETFYNNTTCVGGKGSIDLYMNLFNKDFKTSLKEIKKNYYLFSFPNGIKNSEKIILDDKKQNKKKSSSKKNLIPNENKNNINIVKNYLINKRKLDKKYIEKLIKKEKLSADDYGNCIFYNEEKTFALLRGTKDKKFVKNTGVNDFIIYAPNDYYEKIYLFESPIDALSFIDIKKIKHGCMVSINGSAMVNKILTLIENYKDKIKTIYYCFDNDNQGNRFYKKIVSQIYNYNIENIRLISENKDWNEDLMKLKMDDEKN
jgi:hypothetical protein